MRRHRRKRGVTLLKLIVMLLAVALALLLDYGHKKGQEQLIQAKEQSRIEKEQREAEKKALLAKEAEDSFYQKLADGFDVDILVVGDSIGAGTGAGTTNGRWYSRLRESLRERYGVKVRITNISMGGNTSYAGYARTISLNDDIDYDLAILCYGHNDSKEGFSLYYESLIRAIKNKYPNCSIISILESSQRAYTEKMQTIQQLADYYGYPCVDTIAPFMENYDALAPDGVHPNDEGHRIYSQSILDVISGPVEEYRGRDPQSVYPFNPGVTAFDTYRYIPSAMFKRPDELTYSIELSLSGIMGIDYKYQAQSVQSKTEIYVDGALFAAPVVTFPYDYSQRHIVVVSDNCKVNDTIKIVFETREAADGFYGLYFSNIE